MNPTDNLDVTWTYVYDGSGQVATTTRTVTGSDGSRTMVTWNGYTPSSFEPGPQTESESPSPDEI